MGAVSQLVAMSKRPELFENIKCLAIPMIPSMSAVFDAFSELQGINQYLELLDLELIKMGAFTAEEMSPRPYAPDIKVPLLMTQVHDDSWTRNPEDAQGTFDAIGSKEKHLIWIRNTTRRFKDGYNYFGRYPEEIIAIFDKHMK
jgi:hypothetical protein